QARQLAARAEPTSRWPVLVLRVLLREDKTKGRTPGRPNAVCDPSFVQSLTSPIGTPNIAAHGCGLPTRGTDDIALPCNRENREWRYGDCIQSQRPEVG